MDTLVQELVSIQQELNAFIAKATSRKVINPLNALEKSAETVGRAWSGSWAGFHAYVYFENLKPPPPGQHFNREWGFMYTNRDSDTGDSWIEYDPEYIKNRIKELANQPDISLAADIAQEGVELFDNKRDQVISILEISKARYGGSFLDEFLEKTKKLRVFSESEIITNSRPEQVVSRDSLAISQGIWTPPHISILANILSLRSPVDANKSLASVVEKSTAHIKRSAQVQPQTPKRENKVFIGHGRSHLWKDLQYFVQNRLKLEHDEFNRLPVAGITNIDRLSEMLDSASIAFLVLTAEDEQADGKLQARMNVIHEAGLFQGRLGFKKAIILLEDGCEEFSNIQGLGQIRFPIGNIKAAFEDIRSVVEREGILPSSS